MKIISLTIALAVTGALFLTGCEKELDFKYNYLPPLPVIEGLLTPEGISVAITETTPMNEPINLTRFTDAEVRLTDMETGDLLNLTPDSDDYYTASIVGEPGHIYRLEVTRNGYRYTQSTMMFEPTEIMSAEFAWIKMPYDDVAVLQVLYADNKEKNGECYWVRVYRNEKLYMWRAQSDRNADDGVMTFFAMTTRRDVNEEDEADLISDGDKITISVTPISRTMYDYLEALENDSSGPRLFESVPALPGCLGYFLASTTVGQSLVFNRDDIPYAK